MDETSPNSSTTTFSAFLLPARSRHSSANFFESISVENGARRKKDKAQIFVPDTRASALQSLVKPLVADDFGHGGGRQTVDGQARLDPRPDLRGGDAQGKSLQ